MFTKVPVDEKLLYRPATDPVLIEVPAFDFVMVDGMGDPRSSVAFRDAMKAVFSFSHPVVIALKRQGRADLGVRPLEALWWADDLSAFDPATQHRSAWQWRVMLRQPDDVPSDIVDAARESLAGKLGSELADRIRFERFEEGLCVQLMHLGPYSQECPRIAAMHRFVAGQGLELRGRHHEIYLSDPRQCAPARMRTILRHPVA